MNQFLSYKTLLRSFVFFLLFSQLWTNALTYCSWFDFSNEILIELVNSDGTESEDENEEKKEKEEKKDRQKGPPWQFLNSNSEIVSHRQYYHIYNSLENKKVVTPSPEFIV